MKKFMILVVILSSVVFYAYRDYDMCAGTEGHKALACSACHGGSFANDVIILDGKTDPEDEATYEVGIRIPDSDLASLQLAVNISQESSGRVEVDMLSAIKEARNNSLFSLISLNQKSARDDQGFYTTVHVKFEEALTSPQYITIQGVLSNNDGTPFGDQSFSKEVKLEPVQKQHLDAYFANNSFFVQERANELLRVVDLQGRVVYSDFISDSKASIDLSSLEQGIYQAVVGDGSKGFQSMAIQVK